MLKHLSQSCWLTDSKTLKQEFHFSFVQALNGHGIDRHLLGLKLQAIEEGMSIPKIFMDTAYGLATHFKLRTGQVCVCLCSRCYLHCCSVGNGNFFCCCCVGFFFFLSSNDSGYMRGNFLPDNLLWSSCEFLAAHAYMDALSFLKMNLFLFLILGVDSQMCGIFVGFFFFFAPGSAPDCLWFFSGMP